MPKKNEDEEDDKEKEKQIKKTYELSFEDTKSKYITIVSKTKKNKLRIKILDGSEFHLTYMSDFSYNDLLKISKFFWLFKDIESIIYELDNLFLDEKVFLTLDLEHNIVMKFLVELNTRNSFVLLKIENKDANKMKEMGKMYALVEEQKGIIQELNKENRQLKKQIEKGGYRRNADSDDEDENENEENEKSSKAKDKTGSSFVTKNGSLYDKKLVKPKIDRKEKEKKEKEEEKKLDLEEEKIEENPEEKKENEEPKIEKEEEKNINDEKENEDFRKSDLKKEREKEVSLGNTQTNQLKRTIRENQINYQVEFEKLVKKSKIFKEEREITFLIEKINHNLSYRNKKFYFMRLIYRASEDGDTPYKFHRLCDGLSPLIVLIKTTYNKRFGGFTEAHFESSDELIGKRSNTAFLFNLDREKAFDIIEGQNAICCHKNYGPVFYGYEYCNIYLVGNFLTNEGNVARKGDRFKTTIDYEINDGKQKFVATEVEVYHVTLTNT